VAARRAFVSERRAAVNAALSGSIDPESWPGHLWTAELLAERTDLVYAALGRSIAAFDSIPLSLRQATLQAVHGMFPGAFATELEAWLPKESDPKAFATACYVVLQHDRGAVRERLLVLLDERFPARGDEPRLLALEPGSQQLIQSRLKGVPAELRVAVSEIRLKGGTERLYSIENLSDELNARESAAWRNLIRVLTHEIMNTLTPITSLAQTTTGMVEDTAANADILEAVQTIARRSEGLTNFVLRYRELLKVPVPDVTEVNVLDTLQSIVTLMSAGLDGIDVRVDVSPTSLSVRADRTLLDQVLVNVVKNALEAFGETAVRRLVLSARLEFGRVVITVSDSGPGIDAGTIDQVFVPFFTTRRQGSGIGLSLCRQIMTAHGGEIALESDTGGTRVKLVF